MGTMVEVIAAPNVSEHAFADATGSVMNIFARENRRFSRFRPDSELSRVNASAGEWVTASRPFAEVTRSALEAARVTGGLFDPTVLPALKAAGYDRDYDEMKSDPELEEMRRDVQFLLAADEKSCGRWQEVEVDGDRVRLPEGAELDFGGIAKGWTVDLAARSLADMPWGIVDAGGDLRLVGRDIAEGGLDIAIEDPEAKGAEALRVRIESGGLATTSVTVRTWGEGMHHLIDPRTGRPAKTGILQATVWGRTCAEAEAWSKAAILSGSDVFEKALACIVFASGEIETNFDEQPAEVA
jgi:thiamine biosynthesis lipoprotein